MKPNRQSYLVCVPHKMRFIKIGLINSNGEYDYLDVDIIDDKIHFGFAALLPDLNTVSGVVSRDEIMFVAADFKYNNRSWSIQMSYEKDFIEIGVAEM